MSNLLQIFAKAPLLGAVKTRVAAQVGDECALKLHKLLCSSMIEKARLCGADRVEIWTTSEQGVEYFRPSGFPVFVQQGKDLGRRMYHALEQRVSQFQNVVLVGADAYSLTVKDFNDAFNGLLNHDMVFSPAEDGGYVLVGASNKVDFSVFQDVQWGTNKVFAQTLAKLEQAKIHYSCLEQRWDIDRLNDIERHAPELLAIFS